jgi:L-ascorbate metabolism protein UlaG (beta-lactamase superfamily)
MIKKFLKILKITGIVIGSIILFITLVGVLFVNLSPEFGEEPSDSDKNEYTKTGYYKEEKFINLIPTSVDMSFKKMISTMSEFLKEDKSRKPQVNIPVLKLDSTRIAKNDKTTKLTWFGHSAFLLEIDGKKILLDPMFGEVPAPHPLLGGKRFNKDLPLSIEKLPEIDALIISHDHYDHLDYGSIIKMKSKVLDFYVPLGVKAHLISWGIPKDKIHEMAWWDEEYKDGLMFAFAPSRHFSGRGLTNRNSTLWGSWIIKGVKDNVYFSGDGGYGEHFKEIGEKYGPFDIGMIECGQYNENWEQIHMMPEESAQAAIDIKAKLMIPIHWGTFSLSLHSWTEPVERVLIKAKELNIPITTPKIGEPILLKSNKFPQGHWWEKYTLN